MASNLQRKEESGIIDEGDIVSVKVAAQRLDCHKNTIYHLIETGELSAFRLTAGGRWKIRSSAIENFIQNRQAKLERQRESLG